jgi:hypothetical protein
LERNPSVQRPNLRSVPLGELPLGELIAMNFYEARHFSNLVQKNVAVPDFAAWLEGWQGREWALLQARLQEIPVYRLELPGEVRSPAAFRHALVDQLTGLVESVPNG